jgi:hypothetical protein
MDKDGNHFIFFSSIIGHHRNANEIDKKDQMLITGKIKIKKKNLAEWALGV